MLTKIILHFRKIDFHSDKPILCIHYSKCEYSVRGIQYNKNTMPAE